MFRKAGRELSCSVWKQNYKASKSLAIRKIRLFRAWCPVNWTFIPKVFEFTRYTWWHLQPIFIWKIVPFAIRSAVGFRSIERLGNKGFLDLGSSPLLSTNKKSFRKWKLFLFECGVWRVRKGSAKCEVWSVKSEVVILAPTLLLTLYIRSSPIVSASSRAEVRSGYPRTHTVTHTLF